MYPTVSAVVILLISFGCVYGQQCPSEATTQLFTGDGSISLPLTVPACLTCNFFINNALANPTDFTWSRNPNSDMTPLTNGSFGTVLITSDTRTLILFDPAAVVSVNDIIRCDSASNGQHLITIQSFIFANPIIIPQTDTVNVIEGSNLTINCTDPGNTGNTRYQWFNSTGSGLTSTVSQNQVPLALSFTNIQRTDSGVYICRSTNPSILPGVNRDSNVTVSVQFQVEITSISSNANTLVIGSNYTVNCTYVSNPPPNVTWEHNGTVLESNEYITINTQSTYSELRISLQGLQNSGNYLCKAQNILGNDTSSTVSLTVQVNPDPVIGLTAPTNDITTMSVRLTWSLGFNGNAVITGVTITYTAIGNNETPQTGVEPFPGVSAVEGTISNLQPFTNYTFEAVVMNVAGTSVPETVVVQTLPLVPTPPTVDSVSPISSTSLRVTWTDNRHTFTQSIVTSYRLEYYITGQPGTLVSVDMISSTSYDITGLNKGTNYTVRVYATNSAGESTTASNSVTSRTDVDQLQLIASSKTTAFEGNEVVLECNLNTGGALPLSVTWSNDKGEPIPDDVISGSNRLVFTSPTVSDSANYTCTFQNVSYTFELIINPQPTSTTYSSIAVPVVSSVIATIIITSIISSVITALICYMYQQLITRKTEALQDIPVTANEAYSAVNLTSATQSANANYAEVDQVQIYEQLENDL